MSGLTRWLVLALLGAAPAAAESELLNSVKRNPSEATALCSSFRRLNSDGQSAYSGETTRMLARTRPLSPTDAEVLITYVGGITCPDVR